MKNLLFVILSSLAFAGMVFVFCTMIVLVNNFAEWEWIGYHWPATRFAVGLGAMSGLVLAIADLLDD